MLKSYHVFVLRILQTFSDVYHKFCDEDGLRILCNIVLHKNADKRLRGVASLVEEKRHVQV